MLSLPYKLSGRWKNLSAEVVADFQVILDALTGRIDARNFARKAAIRNDQKTEKFSICAVPCVIYFPTVPAAGVSKLHFVCPSPRRYSGKFSTGKTEDAWINIGVGFHYSYGGPIAGTLWYGGSPVGGYANTMALGAALPNTSILNLAGDFADPVTGNVYGALEVTSAAAVEGLTFLAWFKCRHQR